MRREEVPQQRRALGLPDPRVDLHPVVEPALAEDVEHGANRSGFLVPGTEHHPRNPGQHDRPGAHRARFQGDHQGAVLQAPAVPALTQLQCVALQGGGRLADRHDLGVRGGVPVRFAFVPPGTQHAAVGPQNHGADRHILGVQRPARLVQGKAHPGLVFGVIRLGGAHGFNDSFGRMRTLVVDHPLVAHKLTVLRDKNTPSPVFRQLTEELVTLLAYEATRDVRTETVEIETPVTKTTGTAFTKPTPLVVPILRAGLGMLEGMTKLVPTAEVGFLGMARDEETLDIITYAERLPEDLTGRQIFVLDPMLATGGTLREAIKFLFKRGASDVTCICLLAAPEGLAKLEEELSEANVKIVLASIDEKLNDKAYIVPGLGDAGDRLYGVAG